MHYKEYTFKNGVRVILVPNKEMTTATIVTVVGTGSRYENMCENGLAHFLEHMFFKGTVKRKSAQIISAELDGLGAAYNAYTGDSLTGYYAKVATDKILPAVDIMADLFVNATFPTCEIKKEAGAILQEISMYEDMPSRSVYDHFEKLLYRNHPLGRKTLGSKENVMRFRRKDFIDYRTRCYSADNVVVCVAGNFPQGKVLAKLRAEFGRVPDGKQPTFEVFANEQRAPAFVVKYKNTDQTHILLGVRTHGYMHKDRYVLAVLSDILGGGMSSRLFHEIRERRGLAYSIGASTGLQRETGMLYAYAGVEHKNVFMTIKLILREMKKIAQSGVTQEELRRAKAGFTAQTAFGYETSDDIAIRFAEQLMYHNEIRLPRELRAGVKKVTRKQIQRMAKDICVNAGLNLAILGPHKKNELSFQKILHF